MSGQNLSQVSASNDAELQGKHFLNINSSTVPEHLKRIRNAYKILKTPNKPFIFGHRKLISELLGGSNQASYTAIRTSTLLSEKHGVKEYFCWMEGGEPLFPEVPGHHGAAITFAIITADGLIIREKGPASACRLDPQREVETFRRLAVNRWIYLGTYKHGVPYQKLTNQEFLALSTKDKFWWAQNVGAVEWAWNMMIEAGLAKNENDVRTKFPSQRLMGMMHKPDPETGAQIFFYWRYMQCVRFNRAFYDDLVAAAEMAGNRHNPKTKLVQKTRTSPRNLRMGGTDLGLESIIAEWESIMAEANDYGGEDWTEIWEAKEIAQRWLT